jgi:FkbM family methyltransferase
MRIVERLIKAAGRAIGLEISRRSSAWNWNYNPRLGDDFIIIPLIESYLHRKGGQISFVDVGAGADDEPFAQIVRSLSKDTTRLYGFELDPNDCDRLNKVSASNGAKHSFYPVGLWGHEGEMPAFVTRAPAGSSLYEPNVALNHRLTYSTGSTLAEILEVVSRPVIPVTTIDIWSRRHEIGALDFIKLNIQGGELEVLRGAVEALPAVLGIQIEMAFNQTYIGAPRFPEVDEFLVERGFHFFDMLSFNHVGRKNSPVTIKNVRVGQLFPWPSRQLFEGVFLYLRDPIAENDEANWPTDRILKLAAIAEAYGQIEYAFELLAYSIKRNGDDPGASEVSVIERTARRIYENLPKS